jgi:hypothetical protein
MRNSDFDSDIASLYRKKLSHTSFEFLVRQKLARSREDFPLNYSFLKLLDSLK